MTRRMTRWTICWLSACEMIISSTSAKSASLAKCWTICTRWRLGGDGLHDPDMDRAECGDLGALHAGHPDRVTAQYNRYLDEAPDGLPSYPAMGA